MKTLAMLFALLAVEAHAACVLDQFAPGPEGVCSVSGVRSVTQNGITISYACDEWTIDKDRDAPGMDCMSELDWVSMIFGWDGLFAQEPSDGYALRHAHPVCGVSEIYFSTPVKSVTFRYSGSNAIHAYNCTGGASCPPGYNCTCTQLGALPATVTFWKSYTVPGGLVGTVVADEEGSHLAGAACAGDTSGTLCHWGTVTFAHPDGFNRIHIRHPYENGVGNGAYSPFFIDDLEACSELPGCPHPPCGFERATPARPSTWGRVKGVYR